MSSYATLVYPRQSNSAVRAHPNFYARVEEATSSVRRVESGVRRSESRADDSAKVSVMPHEVPIAVAATPEGGSGSDLRRALINEIRLVKSTILYADHISICSPTLVMLNSTRWIADANQQDRFAFLKRVGPSLGLDREPEDLDRMQQLLALPRRERRRLGLPPELSRDFDRSWDEVRRVVDGLWDETGASEIQTAIDAGLVTIEDLNIGGSELETVSQIVAAAAGAEDFDLDAMTALFVQRLHELITGADSSYPVFDDAVGSIVEAGLGTGLFRATSTSMSRGSRAGVASGLIAMLPSFSNASISELIDIRKELEKPLIRFRASISEMSRGMSSNFYEDEFNEDIEQLYVEFVAPALLEINETVAGSSMLRSFSDQVLRSPAGVVSGGVAVGVATLGDLPAFIAGAAVATTPLIRAAWESHLAREDVKRHKLYLLYRTENELQR